MRTKLLTAALAVVLGACSSTQDERTGGVSVTASALAFPSQIQSVTITATPGGHTATLAYDAGTGQYVGSLILPVGTYVLDAAAYGDANGDGVPELVGTGTAPAVVLQNQTTVVLIRILDVTGPPPVPDHGPFITSVTISNGFAVVSQPLTFSATAVDVDHDPIAYAWSETCSSGVPSTFSAPTAATTEWTPAAAGFCTVRLEVTSNGLGDTAQFEVPVFTTGPQGIVQVTARFVSHPAVDRVFFSGIAADGTPFDWVGLRWGSATLPYDVPLGAELAVAAYTANGEPVETFSLSDDCGGRFVEQGRSSTFLAATWFAPATPSVCLVSASVTRDGLSDSFPIAVNVGGVFTYAVSGTVTGPGAAGATLTLAGRLARTTTADAAGAYAFRGIPNGAYTLTPSAAGFAFQPQSRSVTVSGTNVSGQDFASQAIALAPATGERSLFETGVPAPGWLPRFGDLVRLDASTYRGDVAGTAGVVPFSWTPSGGDVLASYDRPRATTFEYPSIRQSPAPPEIQEAYIAWYGSEQVQAQVDVVASRFHPLSQAGATYGAEEVQIQRITWGPFDLYGQMYEYFSDRTQTVPVQLRERAAAPAVPWTAALATATWALGTYYAPPGLSYTDRQPFWPEYNGDLLTLQPQGVGGGRHSGRTFLWAISGGYLNLLFSDGASETLEIVDAGGDVWGLWSEHRDASGALVAGRYDWAFRAPMPPPATVAAFATGPTEHWQQMINAWRVEAWTGTELRWDWTFGWELLADGTGNNIQAFYDVLPDGTQIPYFNVLPLTWYVTDTGQARIDRLTFPTGENRGYRLLTPMVIGADGTHLYVLEEDHRKASGDPTGPYYVLIAPRITVYERRTIPPPTPPAP